MAAATFTALVLRLFRLGHQSLWVDEIHTWQSTGATVPLHLSDVLAYDHGPLHQAMLYLWTHLAGDSEFALRLPSAVATTLLVPVFAALARRLLGGRAWVPAAWMAALSPFLVWYGQEARNYSFAMLFATAAAWAAVCWHQSGRTRDGVRFVLFAWLGVQSNLNAALVLPVLFLYLALPHGGRPGRPRAVLVALAAMALLESPWIAAHVRSLAWGRLVPGRAPLPAEVPLRGETTFSWGAYPFTFYSFSVGYTLGPSLEELHLTSPWRAALAHWPEVLATAALFGWLTLRGVVALARRRAQLALAAGLLLVPVLFVSYFALQNFKVYNPRYVSAGLAGYFLLVLAGWLALGRASRWRAGAALAVIWGLSLGQHYFNPAYGKEDYRAALRWVAARIRPEDRLVAAGGVGTLQYYWRDRQPGFANYWLGFTDDPARMRDRFERMVSPAGATYVTVSRPYGLDPAGRFEGYLRHDWKAEPVRFEGVRVYRLTGRAPGSGAAAAADSIPPGPPPSGKGARARASSEGR